MHAECFDERIEHYLGLRGVLSKKGSDLLYRLKGFLDDVLGLLDDGLPLDRRIGYIVEHRPEQAVLLNKEERHTDELVLVVHPVLPRMRKVELILELVGERYEALDRKTADESQHALVEKALLHVSEKLEELRTSLEGIGLRCGDLSNPGVLLRLLRAVRGTGLDSYVSMLVLRAMKRAEYSADNEGHFGLAKRYYSHFTSPIRRYPDLVAHRQLALALAGDRTRQPARETLRAIAWSSTKTEFNAAQAERDLEEIKKYRFLEEKLRRGKPPVFDGVVVRVMEFGAFIEVPALQISGMAHVSAISSSFLRYDGFRQHLTGGGLDIGPGTHVRVSVTHVDYEQRHIDFTVREVEKTAAPDFALSLKEKADAHAPAGRAARIPFGPLAGKPVPRTRKAKKAGPATAAEKKAATKRKKAAAQKEKLAKKERRADKKAARTPKAASRLVSRPLRPGRSASAHHEP